MDKTDNIDTRIQHLIQGGELDRAMALAREGLKEAAGPQRARLLLALSDACNSSGQFADALRAAFAADALSRESGDTGGSCDALLRAAASLRAAGDHAASVELLERAEQQARPAGDERRLGQTLRQIGVSCSVLGQHQHALSCLTEAEGLIRQTGTPAEQLQARLSLFNGHSRRVESMDPQDPQRREVLGGLLPQWQALAADSRAQGNRRLAAMALGNHAINLHALGHHEEAAAELRGLLPEYQALGMRPNEGLCLTELAHCLAQLGRWQQARAHYRAARDLLEEAGSMEDRLAALEGLATAEESLGDAAAALAAMKALRALERQCTADDGQRAVLRRELRIELARLTNQWAREASEDALTGLGNRRALQAWLLEHLPRAERGEPLALVLVDLDHFKQVNDQHGHGVGDEVLQRVARLLGEGCRGRDRAVRYGGEEFVLALAGTVREAAADVAERLRQSLSNQPWSTISPGLRVTGSFGVADATETADPQALLTLADRRLYSAKIAGRNRVVAYS